jgi:PIN domain nuclease of toxin-antitoxin system
LSAVLLDTHVWAWSLTGDNRLTGKAVAAINAADRVMVSPISFFEIARKVRLGKWPEMEAFIETLPALLQEQGGTIADLDAEFCAAAGMMAWLHRDPFDRLLAATALRRAIPLVSADTVFDGLAPRVW